MDESLRKSLVPGARVAVTQQIPMRDRVWTNELRGTILSFEQRPTGSWFAHSKDDKLWLDRMVVRKDDGEITTLNLDGYSRVEMLPAAETKTVEVVTPATGAGAEGAPKV